MVDHKLIGKTRRLAMVIIDLLPSHPGLKVYQKPATDKNRIVFFEIFNNVKLKF